MISRYSHRIHLKLQLTIHNRLVDDLYRTVGIIVGVATFLVKRRKIIKFGKVVSCEYDSSSASPSFAVGMTPPPHPLVLLWV